MDTPVIHKTVRRPLVFVLLAYLCGIVWGYYFPIRRPALILIIIALLPAALFSLRHKMKHASTLLLLGSCTFLGHLHLTGELSPSLPANHLTNFTGNSRIIIEGILYQAPQVFPAKTRYYVLAKKIIEREREVPVSGKLLLTVKNPPQRLGYGDVVRFFCTVRRPRNFNNPGSFNYQRYLAFQGIFVTASPDAKHAIVKVGEDPLNPVLYRVERCRRTIREFFTDHLASPEAEIAIALITGEQSGIPQEMRDQFSITGVAHVLAISGLNIGIIALISLYLIKTLCRCSTRMMLMTNITKLAAFMTLLPVIIYCLIAGAGIAAVRATVMVIAYLFSIIIDRQDDLWNTFALAAFCILVVSPASLFDCSFQLSFVSVAAILYLNPRFSIPFVKKTPGFPGLSRPWYHALALQGMAVLTVTLSATLGTAPLVALYFNRCSPWGIPANLIVVPLTGFLVVPLGLLTSLLIFVATPPAVMTASIMELLLRLANAVVDFFSTLPGSDYRITTPTLPELFLYYAGIWLLFMSKHSRWARFCLVLVIGASLIDGSCWFYRNNLNPRLRITAIDVGQGDSMLLQLPKGKIMLIDGGGSYDNSFDIGGTVVAPLLWKKKIKHIDVLVLSHPHPDHLNGLISVIKLFSVGEVWTNGESIDSEAFVAFKSLLAERGIRTAIITRSHPHRCINGVMIQFLHPGMRAIDRPVPGTDERINNNSLVLRLAYRQVSILLTGDICTEDEAEIMAAFPGLRSTILKIPHHGSGTSSSKPFLELLRPRIALLSVGSGNSFRLPHPDVVKRYEDAGSRIFRTDRDGAISLETDGKRVWIKTFLAPGHAIERIAVR